MDKREFLKTSGALFASSLLPKLTATQITAESRTNWAGNYTYSTKNLNLANTVDDVRHSVREQPHLKALAARHSFNGIADSTVEQISLKHFDQIELDPKTETIDFNSVRAKAKEHKPKMILCGYSAYPRTIDFAKFREIADEVGALLFADIAQIAGLVAAGALGVITKITLAVQPTFQMTQMVWENLSFSQLEHHLDDIFASGYSVSVFTDWQNHRATQVWIKRRVDQSSHIDPKAHFYGAVPATRNLHPLAGHSAENCTEQMGIPGPWYERLPHFRMNFTPSSGAELQSEYFVSREKAYSAIVAVEQLRDKITPHLFISEFRTIAADDLWMSPCYQQASMALHFTWKPEWPAVKTILPLIEGKLAQFGAKPHWAKLFTMQPAQIKSRYPKMRDYQALLSQYDPNGKFQNEFIRKNIYGS